MNQTFKIPYCRTEAVHAYWDKHSTPLDTHSVTISWAQLPVIEVPEALFYQVLGAQVRDYNRAIALVSKFVGEPCDYSTAYLEACPPWEANVWDQVILDGKSRDDDYPEVPWFDVTPESFNHNQIFTSLLLCQAVMGFRGIVGIQVTHKRLWVQLAPAADIRAIVRAIAQANRQLPL